MINALANEIRRIIHATKRDVYFAFIPAQYHKELRWPIGEIQRKTKTLILIPGDREYDEFTDPTDMSKIENPNSVVKIVGTQEAFMQARAELYVRTTVMRFGSLSLTMLSPQEQSPRYTADSASPRHTLEVSERHS